jgi:hypothetical protein
MDDETLTCGECHTTAPAEEFHAGLCADCAYGYEDGHEPLAA